MSHKLLLATVSVSANTSFIARSVVFDRLKADPSFVGDGDENGMHFLSPVADYFGIGGAWSGYLEGVDEPWFLDELGQDRDAKLITDALYDTFLLKYEGSIQWLGTDLEFVDLDDENVDRSFIGRKFLIVVDYHV